MKITSDKSIGIIGGAGKTGSQFARLFDAQGFTVDVTGSKTKDRNPELIQRCDIVIFSLPLSRSAREIKELTQHAIREDQLLLDLSSLKHLQVEAMNNAKGEVIGMHPLFAPTTGVRDQKVIVCPGHCEQETLDSLMTLLESMGMLTQIMEPLEHDKMMAQLQVIPHLKSFLVADVLHKIGADIDTIAETCTPAYRVELNLVLRYLDESPDLYGPIIFGNPESKKVLQSFKESIDRCIEYYDHPDTDKFAEHYKTLHTYFENHLPEARERSELCIKTLIDHPRNS